MLLVLSVALVSLAILPTSALSQGLALPCRFYGTVGLDGDPVPDGLAVTAVIKEGAYIYTYSTTTPAVYGSSTYDLIIMPAEGIRYDDGTPVYFQIGNSYATEYGTWEMGGNRELNLTSSTSASMQPAQLTYKLNANSSSGGWVVKPGEGQFIYNFHPWGVIDLLAARYAGYEFGNWTGVVDTIADVYESDTSISMCKQQICGGYLCGVCQDHSITANFILAPTPTPSPTPTPTITPIPAIPPTPAPTGETTTLSTGQIIGISVLGAVGVLLIALLAYMMRRMSRHPKRRFHIRG
ncbi:MAG TPA: hypothetical protein G4O13_03175 [Dehalococcoidia bacterium]|nr:hypothetical protein [Dehalococcoidia bacterium]